MALTVLCAPNSLTFLGTVEANNALRLWDVSVPLPSEALTSPRWLSELPALTTRSRGTDVQVLGLPALTWSIQRPFTRMPRSEWS